ncbi:hypothetical protein AMECASPLE_035164 [Ameca splendens]|uniref:Uncharacterized protein n=1 Tax=Ameca splendens TaxID=208324 RepID=A0ABV0ZIJ4_9TELE
MYTSSMSSTNIMVRHTILHFCQESIVYPEKNVPSGQEGSPLPCLAIDFINCVERPAGQIHNSQFGRYAKRGSKRRQDTEQKQARQGRVRETGEKRTPPLRAETVEEVGIGLITPNN